MSRKRAGRVAARFALDLRLLGADRTIRRPARPDPVGDGHRRVLPQRLGISRGPRVLRRVATADVDAQRPRYRPGDDPWRRSRVRLHGRSVDVAGLKRFAARRSAVATNAALQTALAVALLVGINVWSFGHYTRFDWTGRVFGPSVQTLDHFPYLDVSLLQPSGRFPEQFTLPADITADLRKLQAPTTIVVYQRHKTFGQARREGRTPTIPPPSGRWSKRYRTWWTSSASSVRSSGWKCWTWKRRITMRKFDRLTRDAPVLAGRPRRRPRQQPVLPRPPRGRHAARR